MQEQDRIIRSFPEVESVFGSIGRSDSATDNAPLDMYDTTIMLKPREQWRAGMTYEKLISEMDGKLQLPGSDEHLDDAGREPSRHGTDGHQDARWTQNSGSESRWHPGAWGKGSTDSRRSAGDAVRLSPSASRKGFTSISKSIAPRPHATV